MSKIGYECCICHKVFTDWGNDPWPVVKDDDARCCDACNSIHVIPARIAGLIRKENSSEEQVII